MSITCCGKRRMGNFCPECGTAIAHPTPLATLKEHLQTRLEAAQKRSKEKDARMRGKRMVFEWEKAKSTHSKKGKK